MTAPSQPTMSDERLDRLVRQLLTDRAEDVAAAALSADAMVEQIARRLQPRPLGRTWVLLAAAAILATLLIGGALAVGGAIRFPALPLPAAPTPPSTPWLQRSAPSTPGGEVVRGWPAMAENHPGAYSWDGSSCAGANCIMGFMHNGLGSNNVRIDIGVVREDTPPSGTVAVSVAGRDGMYRRIDALREEWIVDIDGTTIAIRFTADPGASEAELAEAYAIIGSMRTEAQDNPLGFRLIFTLTTDDWDSG